ncbi:MAG: metallophosphoesterase [Chloroflexi bacterium]|nr:metallophosphoesterase [Chloroflexota bacterium]
MKKSFISGLLNNLLILVLLLSTGCKTGILPDNTLAGNKPFPGNVILGSPTNDSIAVSLLASTDIDLYIDYRKSSGNYSKRTVVSSLNKGQPLEIEIIKLDENSQYYYRVCHRSSGETGFYAGTESTFHTQRTPGNTFSFGIQGDSHPDRPGKMFDSELYLQTMNNVKNIDPDFYLTLGDDFSIESLIDKNTLSQESVNQVYSNQRDYLGIVGSSSPLFLINGNHEQAAQYLLNGTMNNAAVFAGIARTMFFPLPAPGAFYTGDTEPVQYVGLLKDYYAWTWGDALFVVIDPYWHSSVPVDNVAGGGDKRSNMWDITLGDKQYNWFKHTLENSRAKYKFVFSHHVLGTGRGGIEMANLYEWGGKNKNNIWEFDKMRPGWEMPIHQLMVKSGVTIFFQGHDHLFCRQELDGVIYQSVPVPADPTYQAFNNDAYLSGYTFPNSGFLNVTVSANQVKVDYINSYLPKDENTSRRNGQVAYSYTI